MTLLERFRAQPRQKHADPAVRLAYVDEIPLEDRDAIAAIAREDEDPRVRRAAVAKLLDPVTLGTIAREDSDEAVRASATAMLRDVALEAFEGLGEAESLAAVDALVDPKTVTQVAKAAVRDEVALRALERVSDAHGLGSIARHAVAEAARRRALERLTKQEESGEMFAVAMHGEHKDTALMALDRVNDEAQLEQIAAGGKNRAAVKRARALLREAEERRAREVAELAEHARRVQAEEAAQKWASATREEAVAATATPEVPGVEAVPVNPADIEREQERQHDAGRRRQRDEAARAAADEAASLERGRRIARLSEIAADAEAAASDPDLAVARKKLALARAEWKDIGRNVTVPEDVAARFSSAESLLATREAEAHENDARRRRDALARIQQFLGRIEPLAVKTDLSLKTAEHLLRDVKAELSATPPLPTKQDYDEVSRRLKAAHATLVQRVQDLREAAEWQRWANAGIQEQLCARMEALSAVADPEAIAREIRQLQQRWREVADVPRAQAERLWHRFKAAHDAVWPRCEAFFAAQAQVRAENLARKMALCDAAEALADSTNWIQTAEEIKRLQEAWKAIGPVSRGREKDVWDRFRAACDRFFTRRRDDLNARKAKWTENLARKEALCVRAEELAESSDWGSASAEIRQLQAVWKTIGPVKKTRSEAIWQRFRAACDRFFTRYNERHTAAQAERITALEAICGELEALANREEDLPDAAGKEPEGLLPKVRALRSRWQQESAARGVPADRAHALDERFATALARTVSRWPGALAGTDIDPEANRKRLDSLVRRMEELAGSLGAENPATVDLALSPSTRLATMLKEALAANTIGGKVEDDSRFRAALEEVRHAQANWSRVGPVPDDVRRRLGERFQRACRRITERAAARTGGSTR